jgi:hypothetical protein
VLRPLLLSLPALAAALVGWALLGGGDERVRYVQVLGGPSRAGSTLSVLLRALTIEGDRPIPSPGLMLRAVARVGAQTASVSASTDAMGELEARFELDGVPTTDPWLRVESVAKAAVLAEGSLALDRDRWQAGARRAGGWLRAQSAGTLELRAAVESGVFAVPFPGNLVLQVLAAGEPATAGGASLPLAGAHVSIELDGAERTTTAPLVSDASGMIFIALRPSEHAVSARIVARAGERLGEWYGALPVSPGAIAVTRTGGGLLLRSPIVRERAYVSLVSQRERLSGAIVPLVADPDGSARGLLAIAPQLSARLDAEPTWAVVSSEYDKRSAGAVGWPLSPPFDPASPRRTFDVADQVLLDGRDGALYDLLRSRNTRRSRAGLALLAVGTLMAVSFWLEVRRGRRATALDPGGDNAEQSLVTAGGWVLGVALACIVLGLGALAYFALLTR